MSWTGIAREELLSDIEEGLASADDEVRAAWERMQVEPQKWRCSPWGDAGGGFWVVAELPGQVVWFNDIEGGFNVSPFTTRGVIDEYWCNQNDFHEFLQSLPEARVAEEFVDEAPAQELPSFVCTSGRIGKRQTTYWHLHGVSGSPVRVHFGEKQETCFVREDYDSITLSRDHPLLRHYHEPWKEVFLSQAQRCSGGFAAAVNDAIRAASLGARGPDTYLPLSRLAMVLASGDGLLLAGPESVAEAAARTARQFGARASVLDGRPARQGFQVLTLGESYIVARSFRFEEQAL
jgi:hypothetical protein